MYFIIMLGQIPSRYKIKFNKNQTGFKEEEKPSKTDMKMTEIAV